MERRKLIRKFKREAVRPIKDRGSIVCAGVARPWGAYIAASVPRMELARSYGQSDTPRKAAKPLAGYSATGRFLRATSLLHHYTGGGTPKQSTPGIRASTATWVRLALVQE
jgi:hypothetical protein